MGYACTLFNVLFKACTNLVDILKLHGYYKVKEMPPEFVNACNNLYPNTFHIFSSTFPRR